MKALFVVVVLLLVGIIGVGFYQGWFHITTHGTNQQSSATITVDKDKIRADEGKAKEGMQALGKKVTGKISVVTEGERQP